MIDIWQEIYSTISRNKLRTFLTGFAVAWGIFMLIVLLGAGNGIINAFSAESSKRDINSIKIYPGVTTVAYDGLKEGREIRLNNKDMDLTRKQFTANVTNVSATLWQNNVNISYGSEYVNTSLTGVYPLHVDVEAMQINKGRFINEIDIRERRKTIVIHKKTVEVLFGKLRIDPVGQYLKADNVMYRIVGVYSNDNNMSDNPVFIPFTTLQHLYNRGDRVHNLVMKTKNLPTEAANESFENSYRRVIASNHRFAPTDKSAIYVWNRFTRFLQQEKGMALLRTAIWVIGIFTLLSGIVGVSNIMLITVKERTKEIGIRKALGAKPASILRLIIVESVFITTLFGYFGMMCGILATEWMDAAFGNQTIGGDEWQNTIFLNPTVDLGVAIQATLTLIIAGTLAGLFPARKAVKIRPIEALRAE